MKNTNNTNGIKTRAQITQELSEVIAEGRQKYGEYCLIVNKGTERRPNWVAVSHTPKGTGGIKDIDIFDPSFYQNAAI
ncbi:DUF4148 domain-containing protein [Bacillus sp. JJ864]|uniref:DUF4148 domain-containing protein n=1 Tax=Bacillus sp. JJ864 TaxID=3122975 RepID=UPI002FFE602A